jgi:hypothetical protein
MIASRKKNVGIFTSRAKDVRTRQIISDFRVFPALRMRAPGKHVYSIAKTAVNKLSRKAPAL